MISGLTPDLGLFVVLGFMFSFSSSVLSVFIPPIAYSLFIGLKIAMCVYRVKKISENFNIVSALSAHQLLIRLQILNSREGFLRKKRGGSLMQQNCICIA